MIGMHVEVNGIVQGVGFRPFIHKLVKLYNLNGWVKNTSNGVIIEVEGKKEFLQKFLDDIKIKSPILSEIEKVSFEFYENLKEYDNFKIIKSTEDNEKFTLISPDVCICEDCLNELFDPKDRRYKFPFINCTNCGPRFTIIKDIPYDRDKTTMSVFPMCSECENEYKDIENRRYHAQPDCCYECGPRLIFYDASGKELDGDPISMAKDILKKGKILAVKGLGGIHLACDAKNSATVLELRKRKHRDEKPFALMCRDLETVKRWCHLTDGEKKLLTSHKRPIVLLKKKGDNLKHISLDNNNYGVMLPYTPVHYLLLDGEIDTLVMTSGNLSDIPITYKNDEALEELRGVADAFLLTNREIYTRCDDSLMMVFEDKEYPFRRSRGYVPFPVKVDSKLGQVLGCGAEQKASFAVTKENYVFISQHIGDLKNMETFKHYENQIQHFKRLFGIEPEKIVCDLHPDYMSTNYAEEISQNKKIPIVYTQHHHAHMASCMADNNLKGKVIGIIWDGTGYGIDGGIWGGEFLVGDYSGFIREGTMMPVILPGGDKSIKDIYRIGYSLIKDSIGFIPEKYKKTEDTDEIIRMIERKFNCPAATSIGRLFDGAASIIGIKDRVSYEGQGAIKLESCCIDNDGLYSFNILLNQGPLVFDWRNMIIEMLDDVDKGIEPGIMAAKFINTLVKMAAEITDKLSIKYNIKDVVLSGGVFQNKYLLERIKRNLSDKGFNVYNHRRVSTNDEGISLGQVMIASNGGGYDVSGSAIKD